MNTRYGLGFGLVIAFCLLLFLGVRLLPDQQFQSVGQDQTLLAEPTENFQRAEPTPFQPLRSSQPQPVDVEYVAPAREEVAQPEPILQTQLEGPGTPEPSDLGLTPPTVSGTIEPPKKFGGNAAPLAPNNDEKRKIVREELPNATEEERQVWLEELQGLPPQAIRDLLRLRTKMGAPSFFPSEPKPTPELPEIVETQPRSTSPSSSLLDLSVGLDEQLLPSIKALREARDVILNNIANANTFGFRRSRPVLADASYTEKARTGQQSETGSVPPVGVQIGRGVRLCGTQTDSTTGSYVDTEQTLDLAIEGEGFFQIDVKGITHYTRNGRFSCDDNGSLTLTIGKKSLAITPSITVPQDASDISISPEGVVRVAMAGATTLTEIGNIEIARFINTGGLRAEGDTLFTATAASGAPTVGQPSAEGLGTLRQGMLEASNVDVQTELVELKRIKRLLSALEEAKQILAPSPSRVPASNLPTAAVPSPTSGPR